MDLITLAICNKKIAGVLAGIDRIEVDDPNKRLTFYFPNGTSASMNFPIPRDGASITDIKVNEEGYLVCRMSDGTTVVSDDPIQTASASTVSYKDNKTVEDVLDELLESGGGTGGSVDGITVPTKTSDLTNDSGFITSIPLEYITETELNAKGYLTEHQDISNLQPKTDDSLTTTDKTVIGAINEVKLSIPTPTTIINSSSTDTEFASTKAVYDSAIKERNIKTFTVLAQLGLEDGCSVEDIFLAAPISSLTTINVTSGNVKNVPYSHGVLIILKRSTRFSIEYKVSASVSIYPNELYIGQLQGSDGSGLVWNKVMTDTDANKLNCVTIDNGSLKEYILTNCTETGKTYYLIAKTTCTDLPKASNFYITVETPGMYTYKVTAKELNDSNGIYVCTYRTISSSWTAWEKVCTTTVADVGKTLITISDETNYKNSSGSESFYVVRNGICYVTLVIDCVSPSSNIEIATLPKAYGGVFRFSIGKENTAMDGYVLQEGSLKLSGGTADTKYYVSSFSYPVAE